jgi:nitrite reductase (NADH) small subunit/3-phenylpropionate/trans-cinnamate dioxygenase ferredoxin subunit
MPDSDFKTVAKIGAITPGTGRAFIVDQQVIAVFNDNGTYRAIDDFCPHMGASLAAGHVEESVVTCPWHAWRFDTRDGTWCDNRRLRVNAYEVRVVGDEIQVKVEKRERPAEAAPAPASTEAGLSQVPNDSTG